MDPEKQTPSIFSVKNDFIVLQNIRREYRFILHTFEPIFIAVFPVHLRCL